LIVRLIDGLIDCLEHRVPQSVILAHNKRLVDIVLATSAASEAHTAVELVFENHVSRDEHFQVFSDEIILHT